MQSRVTSDGRRRWPKQVGLIIGLVGAAWWLLGGISAAAGFGEDMDFAEILFHAVMLGLIFLVSVAVAWSSESFGGVLLVVEGLFVAVSSPVIASHCEQLTISSLLTTASLPLLISGALFILSLREGRKHPEAGGA